MSQRYCFLTSDWTQVKFKHVYSMKIVACICQMYIITLYFTLPWFCCFSFCPTLHLHLHQWHSHPQNSVAVSCPENKTLLTHNLNKFFFLDVIWSKMSYVRHEKCCIYCTFWYLNNYFFLQGFWRREATLIFPYIIQTELFPEYSGHVVGHGLLLLDAAVVFYR